MSDTSEEAAGMTARERYLAAVDEPPDTIVELIAEELAKAVNSTHPPMFYRQVQGVLWAVHEAGVLPAIVAS